jgi:hypothetical protein
MPNPEIHTADELDDLHYYMAVTASARSAAFRTLAISHERRAGFAEGRSSTSWRRPTDSAAVAWSCQREELLALNDILLDSKAGVGSAWELAGRTFRVNPPGQPAGDIGAAIPRDESDRRPR